MEKTEGEIGPLLGQRKEENVRLCDDPQAQQDQRTQIEMVNRNNLIELVKNEYNRNDNGKLRNCKDPTTDFIILIHGTPPYI